MHRLEPKPGQRIEGEPPLGLGVASNTFGRGHVHWKDNSCIAGISRQESASPEVNWDTRERPEGKLLPTATGVLLLRRQYGSLAMRSLHVMAFRDMLRMH